MITTTVLIDTKDTSDIYLIIQADALFKYVAKQDIMQEPQSYNTVNASFLVFYVLLLYFQKMK